MANLERFIEQTQLFDQLNLTEEDIQSIEQTIDRVQLNDRSLTLSPHYSVLVTLHRWVKRVLQSVTLHLSSDPFISSENRYHTLLLTKVRPLHNKCRQIEEDVVEQDQRLIVIDNKSQVRSRDGGHATSVSLTISRHWKHVSRISRRISKRQQSIRKIRRRKSRSKINNCKPHVNSTRSVVSRERERRCSTSLFAR